MAKRDQRVPPARRGRTGRTVGLLGSIVFSASLLLGLAAGAWSGVALTRVIVTNPGLMVGPVLDEESLHHLGLRALILDISNSGIVEELNQGPLEITEGHVDRVIRSTYDEEDTSEKGREVHAALLEFISAYPERPIFAISVAEERPILADSLRRILLTQYQALPGCGFRDDVGVLVDAVGISLFGGSGERFFHEDHPDCRPPDLVATRVEVGIEEAMTEMAVNGPDSVDAFPEEAEDPEFAEVIALVQRALFWMQPLWPGGLLFVAVGATLLVRRSRSLGWVGAAFGGGLLVFGVLARFLAPPRIESAFVDAGTIGEASEVWGILGHRGIQGLAALSANWSLMGGALIVLIGVGMGMASRTSSARP